MSESRTRAIVAGITAFSLPVTAAAGALVFGYCGYIGGDQSDETQEMVVDGAGNVYLGGSTHSTEATFPVKVGPDLTYNNASGFGGDAFVAKVKADGSGLVYTGYIGGDRDVQGRAIAVDSSGSAYLTGLTLSDESSFPVTVGPDLTHNSAALGTERYDSYITKVRPDGTGLVYSGFIGGAGHDEGNSVTVGPDGSAYVAGETESAETTLPVVVGPDLTYNFGVDFYVARVKPDGTGFVYCGYIGGDAYESEPQGLAVDASGRAYVTAPTDSTETSFPAAIGPDLSHNGDLDASVARVRSDGSGLEYAGYIGGDDTDYSLALALDAAGGAYVVGFTYSNQTTFPANVGPDLTYNGGSDTFVARVEPDGSGLGFAGYIGGADGDWAWGVALDAAGNVHVAGDTASTEATFPVSGGPDQTYNGGAKDAYVAAVGASGTGLIYAGYIGGAGPDTASCIAVDAAGHPYVAGRTDSTEATFPAVVGPDLTWNGGQSDTFVAKLIETGCASAPAAIAQLLAVKPLLSRDDVAMSWQADLGANGYNVWFVEDKRLIDSARQSGAPPALPVARCAWPMPSSGPTCTDVGGVRRDSPTLFFYQVRAFCDAASEGP